MYKRQVNVLLAGIGRGACLPRLPLPLGGSAATGAGVGSGRGAGSIRRPRRSTSGARLRVFGVLITGSLVRRGFSGAGSTAAASPPPRPSSGGSTQAARPVIAKHSTRMRTSGGTFGSIFTAMPLATITAPKNTTNTKTASTTRRLPRGARAGSRSSS